MSDKKIKYSVFFLLLVFYGSLLFYKIDLPAMDDMPRHVKNGELILHGHWDVVHKNVYSYTMPDQPFINHHWFSGVIFYLLHQAVGWSGLVIFKILVLLAAFTLLFLTALRKAGFWLVAIFSIPTIIVLSERTSLRPEIFSMFFIALFLYVLSGVEEKNMRKIYWLVPLQLLWVNMHIFFIIGPALAGGFLIEKVILRWKQGRGPVVQNDKQGQSKSSIYHLSILFLSLMVVCFINPNGARGALYPLHIFNNYGFNVSENQPMISFFRNYPLTQNLTRIVFLISLLFLAVGYVINIKKASIFYFMATVVTAVASFMIVRMTAIFALFFLPAVSGNFSIVFSRFIDYVRNNLPENIFRVFKRVTEVSFLIIMSVVIVLKISGVFLGTDDPGIGLTARSYDAAAFFRVNNLKGPVFDDYDIGSYLIYNFYPQEKVFMDNRPEAYSPAFFSDSYVPLFGNDSLWKIALDKYQFNTIFLYQYNQGTNVRDFMYRRVADTAWAFVYGDQYAVIFVRNNAANREIVKNFRLTPETVSARMDYLLNSDKYNDVVAAADVFNMAGKTDKGMETLFRVVCKWPNSGKIWMVMAEWELRNEENPKSPLVAIMYLERAISTGWCTAEVYSFLGAAYRRIGFNKEAESALRKSIKINPDREDAQQILKDMGLSEK